MGTEANTGLKRRLANLRPAWRPGESGGGHSKRSRMLAEFQTELGELGVVDAARLESAVDALIEARSRKITSSERNKHRRTANAILSDLRGNGDKGQNDNANGGVPSLTELLQGRGR
jgi:hypothetical protein